MAQETNPLYDMLSSSEYNIFEKIGATIFYVLVTSVGTLADLFHVDYHDPDNSTE